jgi:hypothetical protein
VVGISDGKLVEVKEGLSDGARVVTGIEGPSGSLAPNARPTQGNSNPFNPQTQRRQR